MIRPTPAVGMALVVSTGRREYNENSGKLVSVMPGRTNPHNPFSMVYRSDGSDKDGVSIRPRACFFPLFSFLPLWLHYNLNPLCVQY